MNNNNPISHAFSEWAALTDAYAVRLADAECGRSTGMLPLRSLCIKIEKCRLQAEPHDTETR